MIEPGKWSDDPKCVDRLAKGGTLCPAGYAACTEFFTVESYHARADQCVRCIGETPDDYNAYGALEKHQMTTISEWAEQALALNQAITEIGNVDHNLPHDQYVEKVQAVVDRVERGLYKTKIKFYWWPTEKEVPDNWVAVDYTKHGHTVYAVVDNRET